jgi:hypothetical protein
MRRFLLSLAFGLFAAAGAGAQTPDLARAAEALAANWRPIAPRDLGSTAAVENACAGAVEEIAAVEASLPEFLDTAGLARVRAQAGLLVVPADPPGSAFFFAPPSLPWLSSGLGVISVRDEAQGRLSLRDAAGASINLQLGRVGARAVLRVTPPEGGVLIFVGCAPTLRP